MRDGQRAQGLGGHAPLVSQYRELAALRGDDLTGDEDVVADVDEVLPSRELVLPDVCEGEHRLDLRAVAGPQGREAELAGVAREDHARGDADPLTGRGVDGQIRMRRANRSDARRDGQADGIGLHALGRELVALLPADPHLLGQIVLGIGLCLVAAGRFAHHNAQGYSMPRRLPT